MDPDSRKNLAQSNYNQQDNNNNPEEDDDDGINVFSDDEDDYQKKNTYKINNSSTFKNDNNNLQNNYESNKRNSRRVDTNSSKPPQEYLNDEEQKGEGNYDANYGNDQFNYGMLNVNNNLDNNIHFKNRSDVSSGFKKSSYSKNKDRSNNVNLNVNANDIFNSRDFEVANNIVNVSDINIAERSWNNFGNNVNRESGVSKNNSDFRANQQIIFNPNTSLKRSNKSIDNNKYIESKGDYNSNYNKSKKNLNQTNSNNKRVNTHTDNEPQGNNNQEQNYNREYLNTKSSKKSKKFKKSSKNKESENNENNNNNINNTENHQSIEQQEENKVEIEKDEVLQALDLDLRIQAEEIFDLFVNEISPRNMDPLAVDLFEMQNLLEVIGIRKNEFEINCALKKIKGEKLKSFKYEDKYTKENFIDVVESFLEFRIEDKLLVEVFRKIDLEENGVLNLVKLQEVSKKYMLNFSNEELVEILEFFNMEKYMENKNSGQPYQNFKSNFDFEQFSKLYYQGG